MRPFQDYWACELRNGWQHLWRHMVDNKKIWTIWDQIRAWLYSSSFWRLVKCLVLKIRILTQALMMFLRQRKGDSQGDFGAVNGILEQTRRLKSFPWDASVYGSIMAFYLGKWNETKQNLRLLYPGSNPGLQSSIKFQCFNPRWKFNIPRCSWYG